MRIVELTAYAVKLPLRKPFRHASYSREASENIVVAARLEDGTEGWGEGVPRPYVTGETPEGTFAQLAATDLAAQLGQACGNWKDVVGLCSRYTPAVLAGDPRGCRANAHRCAVELSILDAFGRLFEEPVSAVTGIFEEAQSIRKASDSVRYSAVLSASTPRKEIGQALKIRIYGFAHCKVKVGISPAEDRNRLRRVRRCLGAGANIRVDANEAWHPSQLVAQVEPLLEHAISCVEQPVAHEHVGSLAALRDALPVAVMLDESITSIADAEAAIRDRSCDLFNIRLSKCGGFLNSLRLAAVAQVAGLGYQLGCHPGESGLLSAAGRHFATSVGGIRHAEGSYDRHVLKELLTHEDVTFGFGGRAPALRSPGLGVTINRATLNRLAFRKHTFSLR